MKNVYRVNYRKGILIGLFFFLTLYHSISLFGVRGIDCPSNWLTLTGPCILTKSMIVEIILWVAAILLMTLELKWEQGFQKFLRSCLSNWPVFIFVFLAILSLIWSIQLGASLMRVFVLICATLIGIYFGSMFPLQSIIRILSWLFVVICLGSLFFVSFLPSLGVMPVAIYKQAWEGIFWHRNYLGCFMAIGIAVFLINILSSQKPFSYHFYLNVTFLFVAAFLLFKSKSATGIITAIFLLFVTLLIYGWTLFRQKLKTKHYIVISGVFLIGLLIVLLNLDFLFSLLGRNTSLTGRIPMWIYLFKNIINQRLLLGYGYGAIWHLEGIRYGIAINLNWPFELMIGDNGFIDILVHLGVVGLMNVAGLMVLGIYFSVKHLLKNRTTISAIPLIFFCFVLIANITLSLILESESFTWMLAIAFVVSIRSFPEDTYPGKIKKSKKGKRLKR
jgi:O-antigen ligase